MSLPVCPNCYELIDSGEDRCPECDTQIFALAACVICGAPYEVDGKRDICLRPQCRLERVRQHSRKAERRRKAERAAIRLGARGRLA